MQQSGGRAGRFVDEEDTSMADEIRIRRRNNEYRTQFIIGGKEKDMVIDSGFSGEVFVDASNFPKVNGKPGTDVPIRDATGRISTAKRKVDVEVTIKDLGITVKKEVLGLRRGGANLIGEGYWPNLKGLAEANEDKVNGVIVIKKIQPEGAGAVTPVPPIQVPFTVPAQPEESQEGVGSVSPSQPVVDVPFPVSEEPSGGKPEQEG
jgi:predicted aspartyl protease